MHAILCDSHGGAGVCGGASASSACAKQGAWKIDPSNAYRTVGMARRTHRVIVTTAQPTPKFVKNGESRAFPS